MDPRDAEPLEGRYANSFKIAHNREEFVLDFGQTFREDEPPRFFGRTVMAPFYMTVLWDLIGEALEHYREEYGPIPSVDETGPEDES